MASLGAAFASSLVVEYKNRRPARTEGPLLRLKSRTFRASRLLVFAVLGMTATTAAPAQTMKTPEEWAKEKKEVCLGYLKFTNLPPNSFTLADYRVGEEPMTFRLKYEGGRESQVLLYTEDQCKGKQLLAFQPANVFIRGTLELEVIPRRLQLKIVKVTIPPYGDEWLDDEVGGLWIKLREPSQARAVTGGNVVQSGNLTLSNSVELDFPAGSKGSLLLSSNQIALTTAVGLTSGTPGPATMPQIPATLKANPAARRRNHENQRDKENPKLPANPRDNDIAVEIDLNTAGARIFNTSFQKTDIQLPPLAGDIEITLGELSLHYRSWSGSLKLGFRNGETAAKLEKVQLDLSDALYPPAKATGLEYLRMDRLEVEAKPVESAIGLVPSRICGLAFEAKSLEIDRKMKIVGSGRVTIHDAQVGELSGKLSFDHAEIAQAFTPQGFGSSGSVKNLSITLQESATGTYGGIVEGELVGVAVGPFSWRADSEPPGSSGSSLSGQLEDSTSNWEAAFDGGEFSFSDYSGTKSCLFKSRAHTGYAKARYRTAEGSLDFRAPGLVLELEQFQSDCPLPTWMRPPQNGGTSPVSVLPDNSRPQFVVNLTPTEVNPNFASELPNNARPHFILTEATCTPGPGCSGKAEIGRIQSVCIILGGESDCSHKEQESHRGPAELDFEGGQVETARASQSIAQILREFTRPVRIQVGDTVMKDVAKLEIVKLKLFGSGQAEGPRSFSANSAEFTVAGDIHKGAKSLEVTGRASGVVKFNDIRGRAMETEGRVNILEFESGKASYELDGHFATPDGLLVESSAINILDEKIEMRQGAKVTAKDGKEIEFKHLMLERDGRSYKGSFELEPRGFHLSAEIGIPIESLSLEKFAATGLPTETKCRPIPAAISFSAAGPGELEISEGITTLRPRTATFIVGIEKWQCVLRGTLEEKTKIRRGNIYFWEDYAKKPILFQLMISKIEISTSGAGVALRPTGSGAGYCLEVGEFKGNSTTGPWDLGSDATSEFEQIENEGDSANALHEYSRLKKQINSELQKRLSAQGIFGLFESFQACQASQKTRS